MLNKKELKNTEFYVYSITCKPTNGCYVGRTKNFENRIKEHFDDLRLHKHLSLQMQIDYDMYGKDSFEAKIEKTFIGKNFIWEQRVFDNKAKNHLMYNYRPSVCGVPEIIREGLTKWNKIPKCWVTNGKDDILLKKSETIPEGYHLGRTGGTHEWTEEERKKRSELYKKNSPFKGKHHSKETLKKLSDSAKEQLKNNKNFSFSEHEHSSETKFKMSISQKAANLSKKTSIDKELAKVYLEAEVLFGKGKIYLVGGCIRDYLLKREIKDIDIATELLPENVEEILVRNNYHVFGIGSRFGTLSYKSKVSDYMVEITTYRSEFYNPKSRHPEVKFIGNLKSDLERRDFCINALAYSSETGIIDYFGGRIDLFSKTIKCVGKACDRFREDPLRILRAVRFATVLDFDIEHNVKQEIKKGKYNLLDVAVERWIIELDKILESNNPEKGIKLLVETELWSIIFPEIPKEKALSLQLSNWPIGDYRLRELIKLTGHVNHYKKGTLKTSFYKSLYQYIGLGICQRLKLSNKRKDFLLEINKSTNK